MLRGPLGSTSADIFTVAQIESDSEPIMGGFAAAVTLIPVIETIWGVRIPLSWAEESPEEDTTGPDPSSTISHAPYGLEAPFCRAPIALFPWPIEDCLVAELQDLNLQPPKK